MAKLRHVAISVPDPEKSAQFYEKVFGMKRVGTTESELSSGIYLSDGVVSLALLDYKTDEAAGEEKEKTSSACTTSGSGSTTWTRPAIRSRNVAGPSSWTCRKRRTPSITRRSTATPDGVIFDLSHQGWVGASK